MRILAALALILCYGCSIHGRYPQAKVFAAKAQLAALGEALNAYRADVGRYPTASCGLRGLWIACDDKAMWRGPYLQSEVPLDPWGNPYLYSVDESGKTYTLISLGEDGQPGGNGRSADLRFEVP